MRCLARRPERHKAQRLRAGQAWVDILDNVERFSYIKMQRGQDAMLVHSLIAGALVLCLLAEESKLHVFPASGQGGGGRKLHDMNKGAFRGQGRLIPWNWSYCRPQNGCWESNSVPARAVHTLDHLSHLSSSQENSFLVKTGSARSRIVVTG